MWFPHSSSCISHGCALLWDFQAFSLSGPLALHGQPHAGLFASEFVYLHSHLQHWQSSLSKMPKIRLYQFPPLLLSTSPSHRAPASCRDIWECAPRGGNKWVWECNLAWLCSIVSENSACQWGSGAKPQKNSTMQCLCAHWPCSGLRIPADVGSIPSIYIGEAIAPPGNSISNSPNKQVEHKIDLQTLSYIRYLFPIFQQHPFSSTLP